MERNGNGYGHARIGRTLWSTGGRSDRVASLCLSLSLSRWWWWWRWRWRCYPLSSYPHRHTRTFVPCLHTSSAACYTGLVTDSRRWWWWCWMTRCCGADRLTRLPPTWMRPTTHAATCGCGMWPATIDYYHDDLNFSGYTQPPLLHVSVNDTESDRPTYLPTDANRGNRTGDGPRPAIGSYSWHAPITDTAGPNRAHDRPPSRTTKTATLYTNLATSWQIDVREYVNTLIVVDLSKSLRSIDWSIDRTVICDICPYSVSLSLSFLFSFSISVSPFLIFVYLSTGLCLLTFISASHIPSFWRAYFLSFSHPPPSRPPLFSIYLSNPLHSSFFFFL